jgi:hypothetical protein
MVVSHTELLSGIQIAKPLYTRGGAEARVREAMSAFERSRSDLETAQRQAELGARQSFYVVNSGLAQVRALTREVNALIRLGLGGDLPEGFRAASFALDRRRAAFVVDAGGRLLSALPAARAVLAQRLAALSPEQTFTVAVARGSGIELAPGTPAAATRANVAAALRWFTEQAKPGGTAAHTWSPEISAG